MSDAVRFLTGLTQALAASVLYGESHPAYRRAADAAYRHLQDLQQAEGTRLSFSFLDGEVVFGERVGLVTPPRGSRYPAHRGGGRGGPG